MAEATICPLLFVIDPECCPDDIEKNQIWHIKNHLDLVDKYDLELKIDSRIFKWIMESYPWDQVSDPDWKQYLLLWYQLVISPLEKKAVMVSKNEDSQIDMSTNSLFRLWHQFLFSWKSGLNLKGKFIKGIATKDTCQKKEHARGSICNEFFLVSSQSDWDILKRPWLLKYSTKLPTSGELPFEPPDSWATPAPVNRGANHGFLDKYGNEWIWCRKHNDHWDVQIVKKSIYRRITPEGREI